MFKKSMAALAVLSLSAGLASASEVTFTASSTTAGCYHSKVVKPTVSTKTDSFALESGISSCPASVSARVPEDLGNGMTVSC